MNNLHSLIKSCGNGFARSVWPVLLRWFPLFLLLTTAYQEIFYMHREVYDYKSISWMMVGANHLMMAWDACFITLLVALFPVKRARWISVPLFLLIFYCVGNALYARNIYGYMPLRAWLEYQNLHGLGGSIFYNLHLVDWILILYVVAVMVGSFFFRPRMPRYKERIPVLVVLLVGLTAWHLSLTRSMADNDEEWKRAEFSVEDFVWSRETYIFSHGIFWSGVQEIVSSNVKLELTPEEREEIESFLSRPPFKHHLDKPRNIVLVVVESLITDPIDLWVDSVEVTPTLNRLKRKSIFAPNVRSEVRYGESSDGQFIYFTGLLPKTSGITIFDNLDNHYKGIGTMAKAAGYQTILLNATGRNFWRKNETCPKYGIDNHYAPDSYREMEDSTVTDHTWLNDEQIFDFAYHLLKKHQEAPSFMAVLTLSTHTPYSKEFDLSREHFTSVENEMYRCYLEKTNYMDYHLGRFIQKVDADSTLQDATIVVVSDHSAPEKFDFDALRPIPLFIYSRDIQPRQLDNELRQIDVYPTLLNMMGYDHLPYMGMGHSVFDMDCTYTSPSTDNSQSVANLIIRGDYFNEEQE